MTEEKGACGQYYVANTVSVFNYGAVSLSGLPEEKSIGEAYDMLAREREHFKLRKITAQILNISARGVCNSPEQSTKCDTS